MKYSAALSLALAGSAAAAGAADTVNQVLNDINTNIKAFDSAIKAYGGGPDVKAVLSAADKIQAATEGGASTIAAGQDLTLNDAVAITTNVQGLQGTLDTTLADLEGIGSKLAAAGQCSTISASLTSQGAAAQKLQDAIAGKAPAETKAIAVQLGGKIGASIANTQSKFKEICASAPAAAPAGGAASAGHAGHAATSAASGSTPTAKPAAAKPATSSVAPKPATFTGASSRLSVGAVLAMTVAAAFLSL